MPNNLQKSTSESIHQVVSKLSTEQEQRNARYASPAMLSRDGSSISLELTLSPNTVSRTPEFNGSLNGIPVFAFFRHRPKGPSRPFLSIFSRATGAQISSGSVVVNKSGTPLLALRLEGCDKTEWVSISRVISDCELIQMGADSCKLNIPIENRVKSKNGSKK